MVHEIGNRTYIVADVEPLDLDGVRTMQVGTALWAVAIVLLLPFWATLRDDGRLWWLWTCVAGLGLVASLFIPAAKPEGVPPRIDLNLARASVRIVREAGRTRWSQVSATNRESPLPSDPTTTTSGSAPRSKSGSATSPSAARPTTVQPASW